MEKRLQPIGIFLGIATQSVSGKPVEMKQRDSEIMDALVRAT